jgi:transposase InsO family protein
LPIEAPLPGRPVETAYTEGFNGRFLGRVPEREPTMAHARRVIESWRIKYNTERPHGSLGAVSEFSGLARNDGETLPVRGPFCYHKYMKIKEIIMVPRRGLERYSQATDF